MGNSQLDILNISVECYPAAKVGGLADVVGSLPKYLNKLNVNVGVVIPKYHMPWILSQQYKSVFSGHFVMGNEEIFFQVEQVVDADLGFDLYTIDIPGKFDRFGVYANREGHFYDDEVERFAAFSRSFLDWMSDTPYKPDIIHCHDHHTGLIPFMMQYCMRYESLKNIPTVFTIHNQRYQGSFGWDRQYLIPEFDQYKSGMLDWDNHINPLASAVKCAKKITTVSPSYMVELKEDSFGLEWLFKNEENKSIGILNGIDSAYWDPRTDKLISANLKKSVARFKSTNKKALLEGSKLNTKLPLISFIGRFAVEKGVDLLPSLIDVCLSKNIKVQFLVLGTGDKEMEDHLKSIGLKYPESTLIYIAYDEQHAHQIYAGSDFLIMPSRVEPCGLNQMYAMRYGTIPIVHNLGGLKDSVFDIDEGNEGSGIKIFDLNLGGLISAIEKAVNLYTNGTKRNEILSRIIEIDNSWDNSAKIYLNMYLDLIRNLESKKI